MPNCEGDDFFLEIWLCHELGKHVLEASTEYLDTVADMLGDVVFAGLESSNLVQNAARPCKCGDIVRVCRDGNDFKILLPMSFATGYHLYKHLYLSVVNQPATA